MRVVIRSCCGFPDITGYGLYVGHLVQGGYWGVSRFVENNTEKLVRSAFSALSVCVSLLLQPTLDAHK